MGELLDKLNASERGADASAKPAMYQASDFFRTASRKVETAVESIREPGMPLDKISGWTRQMPLQALAVAFLLGVMVVRRR